MLPRIAIVGVGQVGGAAAYALILSSLAREILLVDVKSALRDAQARDLSDVAYASNSNTRVRATTIHEAGQCDIVVVTAGSNFWSGETRMQRIYHNINILRDVIDAMRPFRSDAIILIVANPVDLLTSLAVDMSRLPPSQVIGSGTYVDSVRLRGLVADHVSVAASSIDLYVVGVHGEEQVAAWSTATVGGVPLDRALASKSDNQGVEIDRAALAMECRRRSERIVEAKGATPLGIGAIVASICSSVLWDKKDVRPVSHFQAESGCCYSLPAVIRRKGIVRTTEMSLSAEERADLDRSVKALRGTMEKIREGY
ncbi:lactate/malate dehydrogenase family protein [Aspergillus melleus]|uniref:lactate/malate dehydrogenase family protein n=1 Tax=Aspergillus melleus TaxID=138277 RepID=UPI001E8ECDFE|nr:uncharacterized protein LDX57_011936 [Aspergillus melleus]KAH8434296.1 hypothetical protein LDX57_011936 [Aspergillus melleus]